MIRFIVLCMAEDINNTISGLKPKQVTVEPDRTSTTQHSIPDAIALNQYQNRQAVANSGNPFGAIRTARVIRGRRVCGGGRW